MSTNAGPTRVCATSTPPASTLRGHIAASVVTATREMATLVQKHVVSLTKTLHRIYRPNIIPGNTDYACQGGLSMLAYMNLVNMRP